MASLICQISISDNFQIGLSNTKIDYPQIFALPQFVPNPWEKLGYFEVNCETFFLLELTRDKNQSAAVLQSAREVLQQKNNFGSKMEMITVLRNPVPRAWIKQLQKCPFVSQFIDIELVYTHCTSIYVSKYKEETVHENVRESVQNIQLHCKSAELCVGEISW